MSMKIVTWNLAGGDKRVPVSQLGGDVVLLQERRKKDVQDGEHWSGDWEPRGLSVWSDSLAVTPLDWGEGAARHIVPYAVGGAEPFQLLNVCAQNDRGDQYVRGVVRTIRLWRDRIAAQPTVIAGDFNANACWDADHPRDRNCSALVELLRGIGLVSAYHAHFGEAPGAETRPTFYLYRHVDRPVHIDYCFVPEAWVPRLAVSVGAPDEWLRFSDHMPMTVEVR